jgi:hypothetical protein
MTKDEFMKTCEVVADLVAKKHEDYQAGKSQLGDYFPFHDYSYVQMIWVKTLRLLSLTKKQEGGGRPSFEGIQDTAKDLLAYTVFYLAHLLGTNKQKALGPENQMIDRRRHQIPIREQAERRNK